MGEREDPRVGHQPDDASAARQGEAGRRAGRGLAQSERAARLMELLGLSEDELCTVLAVDPLTLLSGPVRRRVKAGSKSKKCCRYLENGRPVPAVR